jgi:hypothetical protein
MQYRIRETPSGLIGATVFYIEKKYKFWPFWIQLDYYARYNTLAKAKQELEGYKVMRNTRDIIHEV